MKSKLFLLEGHDQLDDEEETMTIGFFDSRATCDDIIKRYKELPGFCLDGCSFVTTEYSFKLGAFEISSDTVYYVQTAITFDPYEQDVVVEQGVYLNQSEADVMADDFQKRTEARIDELSEIYSQGESFVPEINTYIDKYKINECNWTEGFERVPWHDDSE